MEVNIKTKFNLEDVVYLIHKNKIEKAIVVGLRVVVEEELKGSGYKTRDIIRKIRSFFEDHKRTTSVLYQINIANGDDKFYCSPGGYFNDDELYRTKEELLESPNYNRQ